MLAIFSQAYLEGNTSLPGLPNWWQDPKFKQFGALAKDAFAPSADALWQTPKYSRIVDGIEFHSQNEARIDIINNRAFNFYDQSRRKNQLSPVISITQLRSTGLRCLFLLCLKSILPLSMVGGAMSWEKLGEQFLQLHNADYGCAKIAKD